MFVYRKERKPTYQPEGLNLAEWMCDPDIVVQAVCFYFDASPSVIHLKTRKMEVVELRHYIHYFASINRRIGLADIGKQTGGKDHATVLNSTRKIEGLLSIYPKVKEAVFTIAFYIKWLNQLDMEITREEISRQRIRYMYMLLDQLGIRWMKSQLVAEASNGRTESTSELKSSEMDELVRHLEDKLREAKKDTRPHKISYQRMDAMRKRILSICYSIGWTRFDPEKGRHVVDMERLEAWLLKYGYLHKALMDYTYLELPKLVTQAENLLETTLTQKPE